MKYLASDTSATRCRRCHKAIVWPGLCYTCATGRPRLLFPPVPDELPPVPAAATEDRTTSS